MVRKQILLFAFFCVLVWSGACGRSRSQTSDTPVPTLTSPPTATAAELVAGSEVESTVTPTNTPMLDPTVVVILSPTVAEEIAEETAIATAEPTLDLDSTAATADATITNATGTLTATAVVTASASLTDSASITDVEFITESRLITGAESIAESTSITESTAITESEVITEPVTSIQSPTPADAPTLTPIMTPTSTLTAALEPTVTVTATSSVTVAPSVTPTVAPTVAPTGAASAKVTPTIELTETAGVTGAVQITATPGTGTPGPSLPTRSSISLPSDLPTDVQIVGAALLTDAVEDAMPSVAELSPDGSLVAWLESEQASNTAMLCIADVDGAGQNCFPVPGYQGLPYRLAWSPTSDWLAFSEDSAAQALESDIWLFDTVRGEAINRTDDGVTGLYAEAESDVVLDYLPLWDPATGDLYFWRSTPDESGGFDLSLMRLDVRQESEPEVVRALGKSLGDGLVRFGWQRFYLHGPASIAPDGSQVAVAIAPAHEMVFAESQALWLIDLVDSDAEPVQLATALQWQTALPQWSNQPAIVRGLQWTADGQGIVVAALSNDLRLPLLLAYYVEASSGEVQPVVDFSDSRNRDAFFHLGPSGHAPRFDVPWTIALAPNANVLLMVTDLGGGVRIFGVPLPPESATPAVLHERVSPGYEVWTRSSSGEDGTVLVYGLLVESEAQE